VREATPRATALGTRNRSQRSDEADVHRRSLAELWRLGIDNLLDVDRFTFSRGLLVSTGYLRLVLCVRYPIRLSACAITFTVRWRTTGFLFSGVIRHRAKRARIALDASGAPPPLPWPIRFQAPLRVHGGIVPLGRRHAASTRAPFCHICDAAAHARNNAATRSHLNTYSWSRAAGTGAAITLPAVREDADDTIRAERQNR
jgi:hypothetical protein